MNVGTLSLIKKLVAIGFATGVILLAYSLVPSHLAGAAAGVNQQLNFQGRLLNSQGATVPDGYYNIQFKIYQDGDGQTAGNTTGSPAGSLKWTESWLNSAGKGVQVKNGFLSVQLGSITPFGSSVDWNQDTLWLSMNVGSTNVSCTPFTSCTPDGEMVPMKRMSANPYALNAGQLGGISASGFIQSTTSLQNANIAVQSANAANIGAVIQGAAAQTADIFQIKANGNANALLSVSSAGETVLRPASGGDVAAFTVKSSGGDNVLTVDASTGRVGIGLGGSNTPGLSGQGLQVQGAIRLTGGGGATFGDAFTTPGGASANTKINIPLYDPGSNSQMLAMGLAASANSSARVVALYDGRTGAHTPTISVLSPDESKTFGLSWEGSNTNASLKTNADAIELQANGVSILTAQNSAGVGQITLNGNVTIGSSKTLKLGTACNTGEVLTTNASAVVACASANGVNTVGTIDSQTKSADGAVINGSSIYLQTADANAPGLISTVAQTIAGAKTFTSGLGVNTGSGYTGSLLNLQVNNASKFSVDETGNTLLSGTLGTNGNINTTSGVYQIGANNLLSASTLSFTSASSNSIQAANNQGLTIQGGASTVLNTNGADININGGTGNGTGVTGLVNIGPSIHTAVTNAACSANCTINQANVDNYSAIIISASVSGIDITLPPPTNTTAVGRTIYLTTDSVSKDFTLVTNTGVNLIEVAMRLNTTSTMIWNGTAWTPGGASNATTLQATYNNGSNPASTPEIKLDNIRGTIDIQDADTTIGSDLLNIRGSNANGLGTVLFGVSNTGRVTIQGTSDEYSAFRVLNSTGDYLFNINSSNNYVISNAIRSAGNEISNPGFESGGLITGGEEGWSGPATASIAENDTNARTGNNTLAITATSANTDVYSGSYYEISAGDSLFLSGWVKNSSGANGNAGIQIGWYDKNKALISSSTAYSNTPGTTYVQRTVGAVAPAGTVYARVSATVRNTATTGTFYFDDFYMKRNIESADMTYRNAVNSTTAFRIQSAASSNTLFTADTATNTLRVGDNTGSGTDTTVLVVDSATSDPTSLTGLNGGIFYRSDSGSLKAIVGGAVVDICTTAVTCTGYSASAGSTIQLQGTSPGTAQTGNFNITGTGILTAIKTQDNASGSTSNLSIKTGDAGAGNSGNITIDTGTATGTRGTITIGTGNVGVTMGGTLSIQGSNSLALGQASTATGSLLFRSAAGSNTVTLLGPTSAGSSYTLTLPANAGASGECIKTDASGNMFFQGCGVGVAFNLQDAYNNSPTPANIALADGKNFQVTATDTSGTDPSIVFTLNCTTGCTGTNGRFTIQNSTTDIVSVLPNGRIVLNGPVDIGSGDVTDASATLFQMDNYNGSSDNGTLSCTTSTNAGALYYNSTMGSIRGCINGSWSDISNPDTLGLLTFGIVPSSGSHPYDLPSLITPGYTGPCRASWASQSTIHIEPCTAYSNGRRVTVDATTLSTNSATAPNINLTTTNQWGHICLNGTTGQAEFTTTAGQATALTGLPNFSAGQPILCIADVRGSGTTAGVIDDLYDVRTFTSAMKEAVTTSTAVELGMIADSNGSAVTPATCPGTTCSGKLYGLVVATNGTTSGTDPNTIVTSVGPGFVKSISGSAGQFAKGSTTAGYATTIASIPNNAFYFSPGNARTGWSTTCTAASNCNGSMYVNFIVR